MLLAMQGCSTTLENDMIGRMPHSPELVPSDSTNVVAWPQHAAGKSQYPLRAGRLYRPETRPTTAGALAKLTDALFTASQTDTLPFRKGSVGGGGGYQQPPPGTFQSPFLPYESSWQSGTAPLAFEPSHRASISFAHSPISRHPLILEKRPGYWSDVGYRGPGAKLFPVLSLTNSGGTLGSLPRPATRRSDLNARGRISVSKLRACASMESLPTTTVSRLGSSQGSMRSVHGRASLITTTSLTGTHAHHRPGTPNQIAAHSKYPNYTPSRLAKSSSRVFTDVPFAPWDSGAQNAFNVGAGAW